MFAACDVYLSHTYIISFICIIASFFSFDFAHLLILISNVSVDRNKRMCYYQ